MVTYRDGLPIRRKLPIQVETTWVELTSFSSRAKRPNGMSPSGEGFCCGVCAWQGVESEKERRSEDDGNLGRLVDRWTRIADNRYDLAHGTARHCNSRAVAESVRSVPASPCHHLPRDVRPTCFCLTQSNNNAIFSSQNLHQSTRGFLTIRLSPLTF